jgi:hypothetical protein
MNAELSPSTWNVSQARSLTAQLRHVATTTVEYDGLELFGALTEYLDQLYGGTGFDRLLPEQDRAAMAGLIRRIRGRSASAEPLELDVDGVPIDPSVGADPRLDQPVNASVTLVEGRRLAAELAATDERCRYARELLQPSLGSRCPCSTQHAGQWFHASP